MQEGKIMSDSQVNTVGAQAKAPAQYAAAVSCGSLYLDRCIHQRLHVKLDMITTSPAVR